jgi:hypothetical protein
MGIVREMMEFYYRKRGRRLHIGGVSAGVGWCSGRVGMEAPCANKMEEFYFRLFL